MHPGVISAEFPDKAAIVLGPEARTYAELDQRSKGVARLMRATGLRPGDTMAIWAGNDLDFLTCCWAAQGSGLYYLPMASGLTASEAGYILKDSGARALIVDAERSSRLDDVLRLTPGLGGLSVFELDDGPSGLWAEAERCRAEQPEPLEGGDMLYTSGTTGKPKGVRRPLPLTPLGSEVRRSERLKALFAMDQDTVFMSPAPIYHAAPLRFTMTVLRLGGTVALLPAFEAKLALDTLERTRATHSQWVPTMFNRLLALPEDVRGAFAFPDHRKAIHAGAPCPIATKQAMIEWWGPILHEYYSGTESIGFTHIDSKDWLQRPGSVGQPWGCEIHILDEQFNEQPCGETGLVYFAGKGGLAYHNAEAKTREAYSPQGWATMGDVGHVDEDGFLYLTDRRAFTIVSGGVNVYPREIEDTLSTQPGIREVAVFGVPDKDFGEAVQAVIVPRPGFDEAELADALFALARSALAPFKRPKRIAFLSELPQTGSGKIAKRDLQAMFSDPAARGHAPGKAMT
jgi:long-chain acyl-CoA synthetase